MEQWKLRQPGSGGIVVGIYSTEAEAVKAVPHRPMIIEHWVEGEPVDEEWLPVLP